LLNHKISLSASHPSFQPFYGTLKSLKSHPRDPVGPTLGERDHQPLRLDVGPKPRQHPAERHADPGGDAAGGCHTPLGAVEKTVAVMGGILINHEQ
jgi:hypothetical protein